MEYKKEIINTGCNNKHQTCKDCLDRILEPTDLGKLVKCPFCREVINGLDVSLTHNDRIDENNEDEDIVVDYYMDYGNRRQQNLDSVRIDSTIYSGLGMITNNNNIMRN